MAVKTEREKSFIDSYNVQIENHVLHFCERAVKMWII